MEVERYSHVMHISSTGGRGMGGGVPTVLVGVLVVLGWWLWAGSGWCWGGCVVGACSVPIMPSSISSRLHARAPALPPAVTGKLNPGLTSWDALRAALPAGTVSGAPKVRGQAGPRQGRGRQRRWPAGCVLRPRVHASVAPPCLPERRLRRRGRWLTHAEPCASPGSPMDPAAKLAACLALLRSWLCARSSASWLRSRSPANLAACPPPAGSPVLAGAGDADH